MENKISRIVVAISVILLLSFVVFVVNPLKEAEALQVQTVNTGSTSGFTATVTTNVASFGSKQWNLFIDIANQTLLTFNATNGALLQNISLSATIGGNHKVASGLTCTTTGAGGNGWCIVSYSAGTGLDRAFLIDITNGLVGGTTGAGTSYINGYLFARPVLSGFDSLGGTVHIMFWDSGATNKIFYDSWSVPYNTAIINGQVVFTTPKVGTGFTQVSHVDLGLVGANPYDLFYTRVVNASTGFGINEIGWTINAGNTFQIFNVGSQTSKCSVNTGANDFQVMFKQLNSGAQDWYVSSSTGGFIKVYDNNCTLVTTLSLATYDPSGTNVRSEMVSAVRNEVYIYENTAFIIAVNATAPYAFISKVAMASDAGIGVSRFAELVANPDNSVILDADLGFSASTTNKYQIVYWNNQGTSGQPPGTTVNNCAVGGDVFINSQGQCCVNVFDSAGNVIITTYCSTCPLGTTTNCTTHITTPNTINTIRTGANLTTFGNNFFCGFGIVSCTNTNIQTNGVGILFLILLILFSYAFLVYIHYQTVQALGDRQVQVMQALNINPMLLLVMLGADLTAGFFLGWLSNTVFYTFVIIIAGLTTFGIYSRMRGGEQ